MRSLVTLSLCLVLFPFALLLSVDDASPVTGVVSGKPADPIEVENILNMEGGLISPDNTKNDNIDKWASSETLKLGQENSKWNESNPNWPSIYKRIHSDLETLYPKTDLIEFQDKIFIEDVVSNIEQTDANTVSAYYSSIKGKRYLDFLKQINNITTAFKPPQANTTKPTEEQTTHYLRILKLSSTFQMLESTADKGGVPFNKSLALANSIISEKQPELEELYKKYSANLEDFEAFNKTDAARHLSNAINIASLNTLKSTKRFLESAPEEKRELDQDRSEWKKLYLQTFNK